MKIKKGRIFNHRDGMAELDRFIASQMPTWLGKIRKDFAVTDQITLPEFRQIIEALSIAIEAMTACEWHLDSEGDWCHEHLTSTCACNGTEPCIKIRKALKRIAELGGDGE